MGPVTLILHRLFLAIAAGLVLSGCAGAPQPQAPIDRVGPDDRVISIYWERDATVHRSNIAFLGRAPSGDRFRAAMSRANGSCDVRYDMRWHKVGSWALWCDTGRTASGTFRMRGSGKAWFGWGQDDRGQTVRYVVHDSDGSIEDGLKGWLVGTPPVWH